MEKSMDYNVTNCTQCPRHCPITDLQCKRGRQYMEHLGNGEADAEGGQEKMHQEDGMQEGQGAFAGHRRPMPHGHGGSGRHGEHGMRGEQGRHGMREEQGGHEIHGEYGRRKGHGRFGRRLEGMEGEDGLSALLGKCGHYLYHRPYHGRGQGRILKMLSGQEEVTQKELQETLGIQAGSVSEIISKLEARGLVARERDDADKRRVLLRITEEGKKRAETDFDEGKTEDLYGVLSEEEQETLKGLLGRLLESWGMMGQDPQ